MPQRVFHEENVMSDNTPTPQNKGNHYLFPAAGAVLGGLIGYNMLKRL
jgi:hypothetical protein